MCMANSSIMPTRDQQSRFSVHHKCILISEPALLVDVLCSALLMAYNVSFFFSVSVSEMYVCWLLMKHPLVVQISYGMDTALYLHYLKIGFLYMVQNFTTISLETVKKLSSLFYVATAPPFQPLLQQLIQCTFRGHEFKHGPLPCIACTLQGQSTWCSTNTKQAKLRGSPNTPTK